MYYRTHTFSRVLFALLMLFWVPHDAPDQLIFQLYTDSGLYVPLIKGKGTYELQYMVIADEFSVADHTHRKVISFALAASRIAGS